MAQTLEQIVNEALRRIGYNLTIENLDSESEPERGIKMSVLTVVRNTLNEYRWQESLKDLDITSIGPADDDGIRRYRLPADLIRLISPKPDSPVVQGNYIVTAGDESYSIKYIYENLEVSSWAPDLEECVRLGLCAELSYSLLKNIQTAEKFEMKFLLKLSQSKKRQMQSNGPIKYHDRETGDWLKSRRSSRRGGGFR